MLTANDTKSLKSQSTTSVRSINVINSLISYQKLPGIFSTHSDASRSRDLISQPNFIRKLTKSPSFMQFPKTEIRSIMSTKSSQNNLMPKFFKRPSMPHKKMSAPINKHLVQIISQANLNSLFKAKCSDLAIEFSSAQEKKFYEYCSKNISRSSLNLIEVKLI